MKEEEWNDMLDDMHEEKVKKEKQERMFGRRKVVTIDTRDIQKCNQLQASLEKSPNIDQNNLATLCRVTPLAPIFPNHLNHNLTKNYHYFHKKEVN